MRITGRVGSDRTCPSEECVNGRSQPPSDPEAEDEQAQADNQAFNAGVETGGRCECGEARRQ